MSRESESSNRDGKSISLFLVTVEPSLAHGRCHWREGRRTPKTQNMRALCKNVGDDSCRYQTSFHERNTDREQECGEVLGVNEIRSYGYHLGLILIHTSEW